MLIARGPPKYRRGRYREFPLLFARAIVLRPPCQGVTAVSSISSARLWRSRARLPPATRLERARTTTSMGRLTLNILLSFARFEREVTGERIRDKIAASKKKGMWMGGQPSLGYDVKDRKLIVNTTEAETVRHIFRRYYELKSVRELKEDLDAASIVSKVRTASDGSRYGGQPPSRGPLYLMLQNPIYLGAIVHKGKSYPGEHEAIVDEALWNNVQGILAQNRVDRANGTTGNEPNLLTGILFDAHGGRMSPTHAKKKSTPDRDYISRSFLDRAAKTQAPGPRIPPAPP